MYMPGEAGKPGTLVIREGASHHVIMEELLHLEQHRILGYRELSASDMLRMENEAHEALLEYGRNRGWTKEELRQLEQNQQYWKEKSIEFEKNPEAVEQELKGLYAKKFNSRLAVQQKVEEILKPYVDELKARFPKAKIGYRGSLVTDVRYKTGGPFDPSHFDVDAYIVDDDLANMFDEFIKFKDCKRIKVYNFQEICENIETTLKSTFQGYNKGDGVFTFRIWTFKEYKEKIVPNGFKNL